MSGEKWDSSDRDCKIRGENGEKYNWPGQAIVPGKVFLQQLDHVLTVGGGLWSQYVDPGVTTGRVGLLCPLQLLCPLTELESFNVLPGV